MSVPSRSDRGFEAYNHDLSGKGSLIRSGPGRSRGPDSFRRAMGSEDGSSSIVSGKVRGKEGWVGTRVGEVNARLLNQARGNRYFTLMRCVCLLFLVIAECCVGLFIPHYSVRNV